MLKGIVNGVEKDIIRIPMIVNGIEKEGWEVRDNQDRLIWGYNSTISGVPPLTFKGGGTPLISWSISGNMQQTGTPSPDNIIMPDFCGVRTGNLFDLSIVENGKGIALDGSIINYAKRCTTVTPIDVSTYSDVALAFTATLIRTRIIYALFNDSILVTRQTAVVSDSTIDVSNGNKLYICFYDPVDTETVRKSDLSNVMLNSGSTALPYEPYGYKIPITCAGQTVPMFLGQTPTVRRVKKLVFDGTEGWHYLGVGTQLRFYIGLSDTMRSSVCICTHYINGTATTANCIEITASKNLMMNNSGIAGNTEEFKQWLASQYAAGTPVTVWYVLAEPTTGIINEPLAKIGDYVDELSSEDAGVTIPTIKGQNTLTVDTTLSPSSVSITGHIKAIT